MSSEAPPAKKLCTESVAERKAEDVKVNEVNAEPAPKLSDPAKITNNEVRAIPNPPPLKTDSTQSPTDNTPTDSSPHIQILKKVTGSNSNLKAHLGGKQNGHNMTPTSGKLQAPSEIDHVDLSQVIEGIQDCDYEIEEMTIAANQKVMDIEKVLRETKKPVYSKRSELIQHIPEFWLTTLINHHHISHFINEVDEDCLQYLRRLFVEEFENSVSGFRISFQFEPNPYFENEAICKEISFGPAGILRSKATPIRWKRGHDLTRVIEASASSSRSQPQSFFHWFLQNSNPVQDKIAVFIRDDIWPNPLKYFQVHTEDSTIDVSSDGIMVESSGEEDEDESVLVLDQHKDEDFDLDFDDNEDIELLENEDEIFDDDEDEDDDDSDDEGLLLEEDDEDFDDDDDDGLELIETDFSACTQQQANETATGPYTGDIVTPRGNIPVMPDGINTVKRDGGKNVNPDGINTAKPVNPVEDNIESSDVSEIISDGNKTEKIQNVIGSQTVNLDGSKTVNPDCEKSKVTPEVAELSEEINTERTESAESADTAPQQNETLSSSKEVAMVHPEKAPEGNKEETDESKDPEIGDSGGDG